MVSRDGTHGDPWDLSIDDEGADDEQRPPDLGLPGDAEEVPVPAAEPEETGGAGALAWLPAGAAFGTLAHDVLERVDFTAEDLGEEVLAVVQEQCRWRSLGLRRVGDPRPGGDPAAERDGEQLLATGLADAICTPLGGPFSDPGGAPTRLRDLSGADRLDELAFEMPLVGADPSAAASTERDIGSVLAATLPTGDPFLPWAERLARGAFGVTLAGHMTGSIDLVARVRSGDRPQFVVVDYKTNRLHDHGTGPSPGAYGAAAMQRSMVEHHYPLQALIYMVALHRYLRWRLPGYDPGANLGGACYLFLRGMKGANTPIVEGVTEGVCGWQPPAAAVTAVSDLLGFGPDAGGGP